MNDVVTDAHVPELGAGALLRRARESAGLHVAALAVSLKVPVRQIEALEADRLDLLPDPTFARALASSVCRQLRIDPQPILGLMPQAGPRSVKVPEGLEAFRGPGEAAASWTERLGRPAVLGAGGLLVAAVVLLALPSLSSIWTWASAGSGATPAPAAAPAVAPQAPDPAPGGAPGMVLESVQPSMVPSVPASSASAILPAPSAGLLPAPGSAPAVPATAATAATPGTGTSPVTAPARSGNP